MNLSKVLLFSQLCTMASSSSLRGDTNRELRNRIIGGSEATEGRYSFPVSLQDGVGHFCGGSLIAKNIVLSAAHCMQAENKSYQAVIGRHSLNSDEGDVVTVKMQIPHPSYDPDTTDNDYMILILDRDTEEDVDLIQLSPDTVAVDSAVTVVGWGDTDPTSAQKIASELMETEVFVISNDECEQSSGTVGGMDVFGMTIGGYSASYSERITENMMCATDSGEDSCQGDSGGPIFVRSDSGDVQVGVVSWGVGCADKNFPGVYARVSAQYDWIKQQVCDATSEAPEYFGCEDNKLQTFETQNLIQEAEGWTTITEEDFAAGFGLFDRPGNDSNHYNSASGRDGVVLVGGGAGGSSELQSHQISLASSPFTEYKITFSFYAIEMEDSDDLCLEYELDDGAITGQKCWSSQHSFENNMWYDDMSLQFSAPGAQNLSLHFRVEGDDDADGVLLDVVTIQGQI